MKATEFISEHMITELTRPDFDQAKEILKKAGYTLLGSGGFGDVYEKPGANYVLKVFSKFDKGYKAYVEFCKQQSNPHFPKFFGKLVNVSELVLAIRTEKLERDDDALESNDYDQMNMYMGNRYKFENEEAMLASTSKVIARSINVVLEIDQQHPGMKDALDLISFELVAKKSCSPDLFYENIMRRGSTLVLSDPLQ